MPQAAGFWGRLLPTAWQAPCTSPWQGVGGEPRAEAASTQSTNFSERSPFRVATCCCVDGLSHPSRECAYRMSREWVHEMRCTMKRPKLRLEVLETRNMPSGMGGFGCVPLACDTPGAGLSSPSLASHALNAHVTHGGVVDPTAFAAYVTRAGSQVSVPDGGTMILGGIRETVDKDETIWVGG